MVSGYSEKNSKLFENGASESKTTFCDEDVLHCKKLLFFVLNRHQLFLRLCFKYRTLVAQCYPLIKATIFCAIKTGAASVFIIRKARVKICTESIHLGFEDKLLSAQAYRAKKNLIEAKIYIIALYYNI